MATGEALSEQRRSPAPFVCTSHRAIDPIAAEWDQLVSRDVPHLRAGFLRAAERSGVMQRPAYFLLRRDGRPVAAAVSYSVPVPEFKHPSIKRPWHDGLRRLMPWNVRKSMRICGSPIGNAEKGVYFSPTLSADERRDAFRQLAPVVMRSAGIWESIFFKEFTQEEVAGYASDLEKLGFFPFEPGPAMRLTGHWATHEDYLMAMRKRYRNRIRGDLKKAAVELDFTLLDSFADLAPRATALYKNVVAKAGYTLQTMPEGFFAALSDFDQAKLLVARRRETGEVVGINLLLFGDTVMHNTYIGFDYEQNERTPLYFSLAEHSIRLALDRKCQDCRLGQASYDFKARQGAVPVPLTSYMMNRVWFIHKRLLATRDKYYPKGEGLVTHNVFHAEGGEDD